MNTGMVMMGQDIIAQPEYIIGLLLIAMTKDLDIQRKDI
jgi:hypothetical protein